MSPAWRPQIHAQIFPAGWDSKASAWQEGGSFYKANSQAGLQRSRIVPLRGTGNSGSMGEQGSGRTWGQALEPAYETAPRKAERNILTLPAQQPAFSPPDTGDPSAPQHVPCSWQGWRAGSSAQAGTFLCLQSFYSIKISGSYSATSPLYCREGGGIWGAGRRPPTVHFSPPACKGSFPTCWEPLGRNPPPQAPAGSPQGLLCACPVPCPRSAAGADSFKELFIDTETSVVFPVDKTFSCGPLKK